MRVVIADDSLLVREGIAALLRRAGIEVVGAGGRPPTSCCAAVDEHEPDVAIVDIRMPPTLHRRGAARGARDPRAPPARSGS